MSVQEVKISERPVAGSIPFKNDRIELPVVTVQLERYTVFEKQYNAGIELMKSVDLMYQTMLAKLERVRFIRGHIRTI